MLASRGGSTTLDQAIGEISRAIPENANGFPDRFSAFHYEFLGTEKTFQGIAKLSTLYRVAGLHDPNQFHY